jgi:hypothetical protein
MQTAKKIVSEPHKTLQIASDRKTQWGSSKDLVDVT